MNSHTKTHETLWNRTRDQDNIDEEIDALYRLLDATNDLQNALKSYFINEGVDGDLFSTVASYEPTGPMNMLEAMEKIVNNRLCYITKVAQ